MKYLSVLLFVLSGCSSFNHKTTNVNSVDVQNGTGINPYMVNEYPTPQRNLTNCISGKLDEVISGNEATTIWYIAENTVGLTSMRLPHTYPIRLKLFEKGFCFDYFDVTYKNVKGK
jgi:hypothetical protein